MRIDVVRFPTAPSARGAAVGVDTACRAAARKAFESRLLPRRQISSRQRMASLSWPTREGLPSASRRGLSCLRTRRTRNCVSRPTFVGLVSALNREAEKTWRCVNGPENPAVAGRHCLPGWRTAARRSPGSEEPLSLATKDDDLVRALFCKARVQPLRLYACAPDHPAWFVGQARWEFAGIASLIENRKSLRHGFVESTPMQIAYL
jgi:hypothetical protein